MRTVAREYRQRSPQACCAFCTCRSCERIRSATRPGVDAGEERADDHDQADPAPPAARVGRLRPGSRRHFLLGQRHTRARPLSPVGRGLAGRLGGACEVALPRGGGGRLLPRGARAWRAGQAIGRRRTHAARGVPAATRTSVPPLSPVAAGRLSDGRAGQERYSGSAIGVHGPHAAFAWLGHATAWPNWTLGCVAVGTRTEIERIARWVEANAAGEIVIL